MTAGNVGRALAAATSLPEFPWEKTAVRCRGYVGRHNQWVSCHRGAYFIRKNSSQTMCGACHREINGRFGALTTPPTCADIRAGTWLPDPVAAAILDEMGGRIAVCDSCDNVRFMDMDVCDRCADAADGGTKR